ncbi:protein-methionine sulfoxide oxidase MICAL2-like protein, partial [Dinothrombium tinctorium]
SLSLFVFKFILDLKPGPFNTFYPALKKGITGNNRLDKNWKSQSIFLKIDRKASNRVYHYSGTSNPSKNITSNGSHHHHYSTSNTNCVLQNRNCLIVGGGPCGLRTAIELQFLGANHVVIVEKRDRFSRNNVLHLWPFVISDLKQLAGKKFYGKFCAGSIDHVSIRQLQLMLIKLALIIGCEFIENITFEEICPRNLTTNKSSSRQTSPNGLQPSSCSTSPTTPTCKRKISFCYEKEVIDGNCISSVLEEEESINDGEFKEDANCHENVSHKRQEVEKNEKECKTNEVSENACKQALDDCRCCCHRHRRKSGSESWSCISDNYIGAFAHFSITSSNPLTASSCLDYNALLEKLHTYSFDILVGADGRRNTLADFFPRKEFRGRLAIAITANFINNHTLSEAQIPEISGISFIYNQQLFKALHEETGIDLENICYYKDDTHYFVMTAKKSSLLARGVLFKDYSDTRALLAPTNINRNQLLNYARDAARWTTGYEPLNFALNHYGEADVAMFDFTSMYAAENACRAKRIVRYAPSSCICDKSNHSTGHQPCKKIKSDSTKSSSIEDEGLLLISLVGDSLLEPFWPTGSGCGRGFLSSMDAAWLVRQWVVHRCRTIEDEEQILKVLSERESIYRLLGQTKSENLSQNYPAYTINPITRYPNLTFTLLPHQCKYLLYEDPFPSPEMKRKRNLAFKRLRRATIATTTPFTGEIVNSNDEKKTEETFLKETNSHQSYEESLAAFEENYKGLMSSEDNGSNIMSSSIPSGNKILQQASYDLCLSPSATTMAQLGRSRAKDIETAMRHRRQREQLLRITSEDNQTHTKAQQQYINHMQQQLKSKAAWLMDDNNSKSSVSEEVSSISKGCFNSRVKDLEAKLYAASGLSYSENQKPIEKQVRLPSTKSGSHVMATASTLEQLFDPRNQEKALKEQVRKKMEKEIKFVGKFTPDDWNFKCWEERQRVTPSPKLQSPEPRSKEQKEGFEKHLSYIQKQLSNVDERHKPVRRERKEDKEGQWINLLKEELKDRSVVNEKEVKNNTQESKENINIVKEAQKWKDEKKQTKTCTKCHNPVAPVDKILLNGAILHRSCLKCARCDITLKLSEVRSKTVTDCLSVNNRGKEDAANIEYLCILCCKNKVNNNNNNSAKSNQIVEKTKSLEEKLAPKHVPITPPPVSSNKTAFLTTTSTDNEYETRLKERMKWKEIFLLNNNDVDLRSKEPKSDENRGKDVIDTKNEEKEKDLNTEPKKVLNERIEYENTSISFELYDEDELTKLLNLESDQWDTDDDETEDSSSWDQSDSTDKDFDSDEFDASENVEVVKEVENAVQSANPTEESESVREESDRNSSEIMTDTKETKEEETNDETTSVGNKSTGSIDHEIEDIATPVNAIKEFNTILKRMESNENDKDETETTISSLSGKGSSIFDDINLISVMDGEEDLSTNNPNNKKEIKTSSPSNLAKFSSPKQTYFKVDLPKLSVFNFDNYKSLEENNKPVITSTTSNAKTTTTTTTTYSKIPVLASRVAAEKAATGAGKSSRLPSYSGSFTEKMLQRCRSTPSLSNREGFSRWSTQSSLLSTLSPSSQNKRAGFESKRLSFPPKSQMKDEKSPDTPSISKLPFADCETCTDELKSPKLVTLRTPLQKSATAPKACIEEALEEEERIVRELKTKTENVDDEQLMRKWFKLKNKE